MRGLLRGELAARWYAAHPKASLADAAKRFGVHFNSIRYALARDGVPPRKRGKRPDARRASLLAVASALVDAAPHLSIAACADEIDVSAAALYQYRARRGLRRYARRAA